MEFRNARMALLILEDVTELSLLRKKRRTRGEEAFQGIIGADQKTLELFDAIRDVAGASVPVLIEGESGTGKELVANAIHRESPRAVRPVGPGNCGAIPDNLLESELFGHVKGSFTGAYRDKKGRFELADGGTIFLDEVGDLSPSMQVKLLRVLQEGTFERVGGERTVRVDVRVISATNRNLRELVDDGVFREDLFYRLCVVPITLAPLRERPADIPVLAETFLRKATEGTGRSKAALSAGAAELMAKYPWPGNVRELQNAIQYALIKSKAEEVIEPGHLPPGMQAALATLSFRKPRSRSLTREAVARALQENGGSRTGAARTLGVSRATLYRFLDGSGENKS
jgi:transcriptional regulator with GAF, ATPase, and Fis domain